MVPVVPPAEIVEQALIDWVQEACDAVRVNVRWLGFGGELPANAELLWDGRPCMSQPRVRLTAIVDGHRVGSWSLTPRLDLYVRVPVAPRSVARGQTFTTVMGEVQLSQISGRVRAGTWIARADLEQGDPVTTAVARARPDAARGAVVTIEVVRGTVHIRAPGTLMQDAWTGQAVRVLNDVTRVAQTGRLIDATTVRLD